MCHVLFILFFAPHSLLSVIVQIKIKFFYAKTTTLVFFTLFSNVSRVLAGRPAGRTDASAPLSAGAASPPPPLLAWGGGGICCTLGSPVKETVQ